MLLELYWDIILQHLQSQVRRYWGCSSNVLFLIEMIDGCENNPESSFTTRVGEHIPSGFSISTTSSFKT